MISRPENIRGCGRHPVQINRKAEGSKYDEMATQPDRVLASLEWSAL